MSIKTILENLFGRVMKNGKRIPGSRVMVFGTRIFFDEFLLPEDIIICTDYADFLSLRRRSKYKHIEYIPESRIKELVAKLEGENSAEEWEKLYNYIERKYGVRKFDLTVMNPPYGGKGDPLYMEITKVLYDCMSENGTIKSINPTTVMDNTYGEASDYSASLIKKYGGLKVEDVVYDDSYRMSFGNATINSGLGIFTYSKRSSHTLFDDYIREKRFGKHNWTMRKNIVEKSLSSMKRISGDEDMGIEGISSFKGIVISEPKPRGKEIARIQNEIGNDKHIVVMPFIAGSVNKKTGNHNFDWCSVQTKRCLSIQRTLENIAQFFITCDSKGDAINLIKWLNTDFIQYIVSHYKKNVTNSVVLFKLLPQPPAIDGNYSDEVLMKHFNLTREEMDWIHSEMKDFGWKVCKDLKLKNKTEAELMAYIDEINK